MERLVWISLAGAAGTAGRYLLTVGIAQRFGSALPYGTLVVNLSGCFAIAALVPAGAALGWSATVGASGAALLNVALTMVGGLVAGWLGLVAGRQFVAP